MSRDRTDYRIRMIMKQNRDGSPDRQRSRYRNLMRCVQQLRQRGYAKTWDVHRIGKREVHRLVDDWRREGFSGRTIANRMVDIRWLAGKLGRADMIPTNKQIGIGMPKKRQIAEKNRAREIDHGRLSEMELHAQLVTELRREFGLRASEAMKFQHEYATREAGWVRLAGSWCFGGNPRRIRITTDRQRDLLDRVGRHQESQPRAATGWRSMIPADMTYRSYSREYNRARYAAGLPGEGLRVAWAQERFEQIAGFAPPAAGGAEYGELSGSDRARWDEAAKILGRELGLAEGRDDSMEIYIGSRKRTDSETVT